MNLFQQYIKKILLFFYILSLLVSCNKQDSSFEVQGKVLADIDSIGMYPGFVSKKLIDTTLFVFSSKVENGEFVIKGEMPYPHMLNLHSPKVGMSYPFFVEKGITNISISFESSPEVRFLDESMSSTQLEYELLLRTKLDSIYNKMGLSNSLEEFKENKKQLDLALTDHLVPNPNSYVVLWMLIDQFCRSSYEYNKKYEDALDRFSSEIRNLAIFKNFKRELLKSKNFSFTNIEIPLKNINETNMIFKPKDFKNEKFLLVDFWFSNCGPCLTQMPKFKPIYNKYKPLGFEIVSISVDGKKDIINWKRIIEEKGFNWIHYLDLNGHETKKINITSYPTTYLIDTDGNVIKKNITPERLDKYLNDSL